MAVLLSLSAPAPLGRMASLDASQGYEQLQVLQVAAPDPSADALALAGDESEEHGTPSKSDTSALIKAAKKAEAESRKAVRDTEKAEAREQLSAQKERERALQKAHADEEKRNADGRKKDAAQKEEAASETKGVDSKSGVNWTQEKRKAARAEELEKLKAQKERERTAQKDANKAERQRLNGDAREAQKRLGDAQRGAVGGDAPTAPEKKNRVRESTPNGGEDDRDEVKAQAKVQRDAERDAAKAQNEEQKASAKAQNDAERARAKEQTEELKKDNEKQRFREAQGRYEAAIATTERVADQKRASKGPTIPVQDFDETGRCPVVGSCGGGDLGVMPDTENNDAGALPSDDPLCVGSDCNGGGKRR